MDFRIANHNANPNNFKKHGGDVNISVYVALFELEFPTADVDYTEYRYSKEDYEAHTDEIINAIIRGFEHALNTGDFVDYSGYATISNQPTGNNLSGLLGASKSELDFQISDLICYKGFEESIFQIVEIKKNRYIVVELGDRTRTKNEIPFADKDKLQRAVSPLLVKEMELEENNLGNIVEELQPSGLSGFEIVLGLVLNSINQRLH